MECFRIYPTLRGCTRPSTRCLETASVVEIMGTNTVSLYGHMALS